MSMGQRIAHDMCCCCVLMSTSLCANIENIKGTYTILNDNYKDFSLAYGAIAAESGYLMRLYDYGTLGKDIAQAPAVVRLARTFFHREPGQTGSGDFVLTIEIRNADDDDKQAIINGIAWTLAKTTQLRKLQQQPPGLGELQTKIQKLSTGKIDLSSLKRLSKRAPIENIVRCIQDTEDNDLKLFKLLWTAYQEESSPDPIFPSGSTNAVILGVIYKIAGDHKEWIKSFYQKLNEQMGNKNETIFTNQKFADSQEPSWQSWVNDKFSTRNREELSHMLDTVKVFVPDQLEALNNYLEQIVCLALVPGIYPAVIEYGKANYTYQPAMAATKTDPTTTEPKRETISFSDCMETTLRNLTNFILYNHETKTFAIPGGLNPTDELKNFYHTYAAAAQAGSSGARNAWTQVVENIPGVSYAKELSEKSVHYELNPSVTNIIIVLNHIFGLNLFADEQGNSPEEKLKNALSRVGKDFIKTYFPKLCNLLNLQLDGFFGLDDSKITLDDIDHMDSRVVTKLHIIKRDDAYEHTIAVEVRTTPEHGQFECSREAATDSVAHLLSSKFDNLILLGKNTRRVEFLSLCYLTLYKKPDMLKEYLQKIGNHFQLNGFLYLPIENPDYVSGQLIPTLEQIFYDRQVPSGEQTLSRHALRLCLNLCTNAPDTNRRQMCQLRVYTLFASLYPFQAQDIELGQVYKDALALAKSIMKSEESYEAVRLLLEALLGQGYGYRAILQEASSLSGNKPHLALPLFDLLIKKGIFKLPDKKFSQILSTVYRNAIDKLRESHPDDTLDLLRALVENEQAYDLALESARTAFKDGNERGLQLFKALFEKNKGYEEAIETASQMIESNQRAALRLFKALFEEGQGYQQALEAARKAQKNGQLDIALELFEALVEKGQGYNEAVKAASQALKNGYINDALELFIILVKKEQGYNEAIKAASQGLDRYPYTALQLFKILTEKGQGYNEAVKAASQALKNGYINDALELFIILVKKEQGYNEAIKAASQAFAAEVTAHSALQLFKALLEGGRGYQQALEAALEAWNQNRVADARELSIELLKNVETYDRAVRSASKGLKDGEPGASGLLRKLVQIPQELVTHNVPDLDKPTESDDDKKKLMTSLALALNTFEFLVNLDHGYQEAQNAAQMVRQRVNHKGLKNKADRLAQLVQEKTTPR